MSFSDGLGPSILVKTWKRWEEMAGKVLTSRLCWHFFVSKFYHQSVLPQFEHCHGMQTVMLLAMENVRTEETMILIVLFWSVQKSQIFLKFTDDSNRGFQFFKLKIKKTKRYFGLENSTVNFFLLQTGIKRYKKNLAAVYIDSQREHARSNLPLNKTVVTDNESCMISQWTLASKVKDFRLLFVDQNWKIFQEYIFTCGC